jgi:hypothetical protein
MKSIKLFVTMYILLLSINSIAQNIGINNTNPQASLDVQGDLRLRSAVLTLPNGLNNDVDLTTTKSSVYMFAGGALAIGGAQITGFTGGVDGRIVTIFNNSTTGAIQLYDANFSVSPSATANKILTGTNNNVVIFGSGSVTLRYDGAKQKWTVIGSNYTAGLDANPSPWDILGNNISNSNTGNVGIGLTNPVSKLDVLTNTANAIAISGVNTAGGYGVYGRSLVGGFGVLGEAFGANAKGGFFLTNGTALNETALRAETLGGGTAGYFTAPSGKALITDEGNVGIGEPAPSEKLQVNNGNAKIGGNVWTTAADDKVLKFGDQNYVTIGEVGADDKMEIKANGITLKAVSGNVLIPTGNVGIGTLTPSATYRLSVEGKIRSKEIVVETGWADYVFAKNYKLPSLSDVEKYIKANSHLPEIPSAEEIQTNGLKLGEVQTKMMQKIEELTLYIIEQNKTIVTMQKRLKALENK